MKSAKCFSRPAENAVNERSRIYGISDGILKVWLDSETANKKLWPLTESKTKSGCRIACYCQAKRQPKDGWFYPIPVI